MSPLQASHTPALAFYKWVPPNCQRATDRHKALTNPVPNSQGNLFSGAATRSCRGGVRPPRQDKIPAMTYSRADSTTIGPGCLTAVFGMGTGVSSRVCSPERRVAPAPATGRARE